MMGRGAEQRATKLGRITAVLSLAIAVSLCTSLLPVQAWADDASASSSATTTGQAASTSVTVQEALWNCVDALHTYTDTSDGDSMLSNQDVFTAGKSIADWFAFDLSRLSADTGTKDYLSALEASVTQRYADDQVKLDSTKPTEWARTIIVVKALGGDPTSFGTDAAGSAIDLVADGTYDWVQVSDPSYQGSNAWMHMLYALDCSGASVPSDAKYSEETIVEQVLAVQNDDGGFGLSAGSSGADLTGMALAALSQHRDVTGVNEAIERGIEYLSNVQGADGAYSSDGTETSESCSMVIIGLASVGIDPRTDSRFIKNGTSLYDALMTFCRDDGSFSHASDDNTENIELLSTEEAMRALIALDELDAGGDGDVYTLDVQLQLEAPAASNGASTASGPGISFSLASVPWLLGGMLIGCAIVAAGIAIERKRRWRDDGF